MTLSEVRSAAVKAITSAQSRQRPILMITCADGRPRVCVPDWGELRVVDERHLRVAVWPTAPTAADLDHDAPTMLIVTTPSDVYVIDATARRLVNAAMVWAHYELTITAATTVDRGTTPLPQPAPSAPEVLTQDPPSRLASAMSMSALAKIWREGKSSLR